MPAPKKQTVPSGGDTPVSNLPQEAEQAATKKTQAPSEGVDPQTQRTTADGVEAIDGFHLREVTPESLPELFSAADVVGLRDIGEASFGPPPDSEFETVHGPDDRVRISNTSIYPWRAIASLLITAADNSTWIGTGWFISPHTLITAGHVVYIKNSGVPNRDGWVKKIQVMPGRDVKNLPYGSVTSTNFRSVTGWTNNGDENFDYGAVIIPTELGNTTGWFGLGVYSDADLTSAVGNIAGYPGDKQPAGSLWYDARKIASVNSRKVFYDIDTAGGQSGSAVYRIVNGARMAVAVHAYGGNTTNSGTRITQDVYTNLVSWKA